MLVLFAHSVLIRCCAASCHASLQGPNIISRDLPKALDFINCHLPPKSACC